MSEPITADFILLVRLVFVVNVQGWKVAVDNCNALALAWWNHAVMGNDKWCSAGGDAIVEFAHLLSHSMSNKQCRSLFRQLVW